MLDIVSSAPTNPSRVSQPTVAAVDTGASVKNAATAATSSPLPPVAAPTSPATVDVRTAFPSAVAAPDGDARVEAQAIAGETASAGEPVRDSRAASSELRREELLAEERRRAAERALAGNGLIDDPERPLFDSSSADSQQARDDAEDLDDLLAAQNSADAEFFIGAQAQAPITEAFIAGASLAAQSAALDVQA